MTDHTSITPTTSTPISTGTPPAALPAVPTSIGGRAVVPDGWHLVWDHAARRSGEPVRVLRWQPTTDRELGVEAVTAVVAARGGRLLSIRRFIGEVTGDLPSPARAEQIAMDVFTELDPRYARLLTPLRVDTQGRRWRTADGHDVDITVRWAKHAHPNGTYNWVTVGPGGSIIEVERESHWDYEAGRRATEQWDHDGWIAAREGTGPQLPGPDAVA
ncbi:hypothetical protein ABLE94_06085 [Gordonia sp. VNK1]|uniref:hypothetical protein n=1 Tax=Gordonia oleivorans TaxID=3156618 RepID=UPI0032B61E49